MHVFFLQSSIFVENPHRIKKKHQRENSGMSESPKRTKKAWPTKAAMAQVYENNLWGGKKGTFYSGEGSHDPKLVAPYIQVVSEFLSSFDTPLHLLDLGCGDFNVGSILLPYTREYTAVDIVEELIKYNSSQFQAANLRFHCLDIAKDALPAADCVLVRQVLQHLSNAEVAQVVEKLSTYKYVILTEHLPSGAFIPNADIISGQGIRLKKQSGLELTGPPFNFKVKESKELLSIPASKGKGIIKTVLYTVY